MTRTAPPQTDKPVLQVEHELHGRRRGRNNGVGLLLVGLVVIVFGLTVVKVLNLEDIRQFERFDRVVRPQIVPGQNDAPEQAPPARVEEVSQ